jgi:nucleoside-diphosphate-sugar epimerase
MARPKNIVIIGGTKFIGPYVVSQLIDLGHSVTVYHRGKTEPVLPTSVRHVHDDAASIPVQQFVPSLFSPPCDVVIHMIAMGEADSGAAVEAWRGRTGRMVWLSSGDVYLAYGRFIGLEPGPIEKTPLAESSPLRKTLYPYRLKAHGSEDLHYFYEKILVEQAAFSNPQLPAVVLRLPKVFGPGSNADFATVYHFRGHPQWRWTHGYVENIASAIVLAALHPAAGGRIYNVGEPVTPTIAERLAILPQSGISAKTEAEANFDQDIVFDTSRIRQELGYREPITEADAVRRTLKSIGKTAGRTLFQDHSRRTLT